MVSGRGVFDVSGMKVTRRAARREITPKIASGTWFKIDHLRERCRKKKLKTKLTNVSFMYVCVAGNGEMLVFFLVFSSNNSVIDNSLSE